MMNKQSQGTGEGWDADELIVLLCIMEEEGKGRDGSEMIVADVTSLTEYSYM